MVGLTEPTSRPHSRPHQRGADAPPRRRRAAHRRSRARWPLRLPLLGAAIGALALAVAWPAVHLADGTAVASGTVSGTGPAGSAPTAAGTSTTHPTTTTATTAGALPDVFDAPAVSSYLAAQSAGSLDVTAAVYDARTGQTWVYRPTVALTTASVVKVDILEAVLARAQAEGADLTNAQQALATAMIEQSTNNAANDLWETIGGAAGVGQFNDRVGLTGTDLNAPGYWGLSTTTALDQVRLVREVAFPNAVLDAASQAYATGLMQHVVSYEDWGVSAGVPSGVSVALKNGWDPITGTWEINSDGWVTGGGADYVLSVLCWGATTETAGIDSVDGLARLVWSALATPSRPAS